MKLRLISRAIVTYIIFCFLLISITSGSDEKVVARQSTFTLYENGVVYDEKTGLEWIVGPDKDTNWYDAQSWVESQTLGEKRWRMPTLDELKTLFKKGDSSRNMTPLLKTTGWWVWSGETEGSTSAWFFCFDDGFELVYNRQTFRNLRAFAVRSRK